MKTKEFLNLISESLRDLVRNPLILVPGIVLWIIVSLISEAGGKIAYNLQTTASNVVWLAVTFIVFFAISGGILSGLIGMSSKLENGKAKWKEFNFGVRKFWFRNFIILLFFVILYNVVVNGPLFLFTKLMIYLKPTLELSPEVFRILSLVLAFLLLIGIVIFFTYSNFYVVIENLGIVRSFRKSIKLVKKEYLATISLLVLLFVVYRLILFLPGVTAELVEYVLLVPFGAILMTKFVMKFGR